MVRIIIALILLATITYVLYTLFIQDEIYVHRYENLENPVINIDTNKPFDVDETTGQVKAKPIDMEISNWNTFTSEELGISFKYPKEYTEILEENEIAIYEAYNDTDEYTLTFEPYTFLSYFRVKENVNGYTLEEYYINEFCYGGKNYDEITHEWPKLLADGCVKNFNKSEKEMIYIDQVQGLRTYFNPYEHGNTVVLIPRENKMYELHLGNTSETGGDSLDQHYQIFDLMLSSVKFLN